jgi:hypothetical protein
MPPSPSHSLFPSMARPQIGTQGSPQDAYTPGSSSKNFLLTFQGFQAELSIEEDFLSCTQYEKETLPNFYRRFLKLKAQAPKVSNDQFITQAIKALCAGPLHSYLVRERLKTVIELYENFAKFSKLEFLHFRKLEQERKALKHNKAIRPMWYSEKKPHNNYLKHVNNIDSDGCGLPKNWEKNFGPPPQERKERAFNYRRDHYNQRGEWGIKRGRGCGQNFFKPPYCMYHGLNTNHRTKDFPIFLESKKKIDQSQTQPPLQSSSRKVNHMMQ